VERVRSTCPRDCYDGCGLSIEMEGSRVRRVLGDPDHPVARGALCGKCAIAYNGLWLDPETRWQYPARRVGAKGEGRFERISWERALTEAAEQLRGVASRHGAETILNVHYSGTLSTIAYTFPQRFFRRLGATEVTPDTICNNAGHVALDLVLGVSVVGFDPRTARDTNCILVWGANPSHSAPHAHKHWLAESSAKVVVIDPIRHDTAAAADLHVQPYPGTDAALAFGLAHVLRRDGYLDTAFIAAHTQGYGEVESEIAKADPATTENRTGVPARDVELAASWYGGGPSLLWLGQGLQRQPRGGNAMRACALLPALTGNIGKPGAGLYYLNHTLGIAGLDWDAFCGASLGPEPPQVSHMDLAAALEDPERTRVFFCWNMNPAASAPQQRRLHRALQREDLFSIVIDPFPTDTTRFADLVLPAAGFLEFDDIAMSYFNLRVGPQSRVQPAPGEALPNQEIFRRLGRAMGYEEPELYVADEALIDEILEAIGYPHGFEAFRRAGGLSLSEAPLVFHEDLTFPTPSGRIEIASARAEAMGLPRTPEPWCDPRPAGGRLRLLSPASRWRLNDSYANDPQIGERAGEASVAIHPDDARARGIADGGRVELANEVGRLELIARVDASVPPGVLLSHKGRWPRREASEANVNTLNPGTPTDMGESSAVHGTEVELRGL